MKPLDREQLKHIRGGLDFGVEGPSDGGGSLRLIAGGHPDDDRGSLTAVPIVGGGDPSDEGGS